MDRRKFLQLTGLTLCGLAMNACGGRDKGIPVAMLHKITDSPRKPEEMSPGDLERFLKTSIDRGYAPVSATDIALGRVDSVVPEGLKPLGITIDDSHPSVLYSSRDDSRRSNSASFYDAFTSTVRDAGLEPRATIFLSEGRETTGRAQYFGSRERLRDVVARVQEETPGIDFGYHTRAHHTLKDATREEVLRVLDAQKAQFERLGVGERISPVFAYPYGALPTADGRAALQESGIVGAFSAMPGYNEDGRAPALCSYDGRLTSDPMDIPRVSIGSAIYTGGTVRPLLAAVDAQKDIFRHESKFYVSRG